MSIEEQYDDMLDDCWGEINICGMMWCASTVLKRVDPIAYRVGLADYESFLVEFAKLIDSYGGVIDYEFNLGTFWWENEHGQVYTMIIQGLDE